MKISVHGERNSGTWYLRYLLEHNFSDPLFNGTNHTGVVTRDYFRHNIPFLSDFPNPEETLIVHVVRDLDACRNGTNLICFCPHR